MCKIEKLRQLLWKNVRKIKMDTKRFLLWFYNENFLSHFTVELEMRDQKYYLFLFKFKKLIKFGNIKSIFLEILYDDDIEIMDVIYQ